jgi:fibronectin type 3 domain-containing protein
MKVTNLILGVASILAISCGDSGGDEGSGGAPTASLLIAPINNSECISGTSLSSSQSKVTLEWNPSENTTAYFVYVKNLISGSVLQYNAGESLTYDVTLQKATPYSWYVSSRKDGQTSATSQTWKFYNSGDGVTNYAPFPAELDAPAMSATVTGPTVTLKWIGSDVENAIADYKVYFGTSTNPTTLLSTVTQQQIANVAVAAGASYYWKVVTTDAQGNSSTSQTFQFRVQ